MKKKELAALARLVVPREFAIKGDLAFMQPIDHTLRAISFDASGFSKTGFYVAWVFNPLCVPRQHLNLGLGDRIRHSWDIGEAQLVENLRSEIHQKALPVLERLKTPADVARQIRAGMRDAPYKSVPMQQELGFALARAGDVEAAVEAFDELLGLVDPAYQWQQETAMLAMPLKDLLVSDPDAAMRQLLAWELESLDNLGLRAYRSEVTSATAKPS